MPVPNSGRGHRSTATYSDTVLCQPKTGQSPTHRFSLKGYFKTAADLVIASTSEASIVIREGKNALSSVLSKWTDTSACQWQHQSDP